MFRPELVGQVKPVREVCRGWELFREGESILQNEVVFQGALFNLVAEGEVVGAQQLLCTVEEESIVQGEGVVEDKTEVWRKVWRGARVCTDGEIVIIYGR